MTNILVAYDQQRAIGTKNDLPWGHRSLPGDLAMFKRMTINTSVIMGRKTYESLPPSFRPLPDRENIVLTRNPELDLEEGVICVSSLALAIKAATRKVFVIGGGQIYEEALPIVDSIYATEVHATFPEADTFFPALNPGEWQRHLRQQNTAEGSKDRYDYDFVRYDRIK